MSDAPFTLGPDGATITVRLTPRAKSDRLLAVVDGEGRRIVRAAVTAPPEDGRANEALLRLLARELDMPRRDLAIRAGATGRNKLVRIAGPPRRLAEKLAAVIAGLPLT